MMNYVMSERYRLVRKKSLYVTFLVCLGLIGLFPFVFSVNTSRKAYFLIILVMSSLASVFVAMVISHLLTGKDTAVDKQIVAFGVSRRTIFFTKFFWPLLTFLVLYCALVSLITFLGLQIPANDLNSVKNFWIAAANLFPVTVSAFTISYVLDICGVGGTYIGLILIFLYIFSGDIAHFIITRFSATDSVSQYFPEGLLDIAVNSTSFAPSCWLVSGGIMVACLLVGLRLFSRKDIR